ncbi:MAG: DNA replication/repair protein RecF [Paludibacteraceae bacterium]|nr:DNA replication/repair protein RecF [Paludibacteraceae bacterium]
MYIRRLSLVNFKNIRQAEIDFSPKINCFIGANGAGKTNILDAIYFLSYCKSHSNNVDSQSITHGQDFFVIQGDYSMSEEREESIYCGLKRNKKKQFKRNQKEYTRLSDHIGLIPLVIVSPDDQTLINGASEERRRFVDSIISQYDRQYLNLLIRYNSALQQKNSLLRQDEMPSAEMFDLWDAQLAQLGESIYQTRVSFLEKFVPLFQKYYSFLSSNNEKVTLAYESQLNDSKLYDVLVARRERDFYLGYTTAGIHRDDLSMNIDEYPIKRVGSQGQNKTFLVALKLARFSFLKETSASTPLLLFDDIFDKLDSSRVSQIIRLVSEDTFGQIFITDTNREHIDEILGMLDYESKIFSVGGGEVSLIDR